jgi:hypothetical protein
MNIELDIARIREKALNLIPVDNEPKFILKFDSELYLDLIENPEDYIAEGVASYYLNNE